MSAHFSLLQVRSAEGGGCVVEGLSKTELTSMMDCEELLAKVLYNDNDNTNDDDDDDDDDNNDNGVDEHNGLRGAARK